MVLKSGDKVQWRRSLLDQYRSVHLVLYSTQRQNSTVRKLSRLPAFPGEGAASAPPVLYVRAPMSRVLNPKPTCAMYAVRTYRTRARAAYVRRTARFWKIRVRDYYVFVDRMKVILWQNHTASVRLQMSIER